MLNNYRSFKKNLNIQKQGGAALIVGMIMLLLLTLIGVAGMQNTLLQERMVGAMRERQVAQQAAEATLRYAEKQIKDASAYNTVPGATTIANTTSLARKVSGQDANEKDYWLSTAAWASDVNDYPAGNISGLASTPKYKIERLPPDFAKVPGSLNAVLPPPAPQTGGPRITDYRVVVKAVGGTGDAEVILQSVYRRID
jgi:type IV pilus assembly protein PilX